VTEDIHKVLCLLYHYHHLNNTDLINLFCINLIVHRVQITLETKLVNNLIQKHWSAHFEWWFHKIIQEDIEERVYESTKTVNDRLSRWNAWVVIVNKVKNLTSQDKSKVIFDYSRVTKKLSDIYMKLSFKMHDNLTDSWHRCLFSANLKHAYLRISLHSNDKHYFAFMISDIDQLQSTCMQQSLQSAEFTLIELMYQVFEALSSSHRESSLLHSNSLEKLPVMIFYMNDFFDDFRSFKKQYNFLSQHFFSWVEWTLLQLSFKKLKLFVSEIKILDVTHRVEDFVNVLKFRIKKILEWKASRNQIKVRFFLKVVDITHHWVKNFAKLSYFLAQLTRKVLWKWEQLKQLSFKILQIKCAIRTSMCNINLSLSIHFYMNASNFAASLVITQFQELSNVNIKNNKLVKVFILYNFFSWFVLQRKYSVYKKKLCAIITFVKKYDYLCKHSYISVIVHTNHKLLTYFLKFNLHERIYEHWVDKLHRLNVSIVYISDHWNKVADELSRTLFNSDDYSYDRKVQKITIELMKQSSHWVWWDEKKNFEELLTKLTLNEWLEIIEHSTINDMFIFDLNIMTTTSENIFWKQIYKHFVWFKDIYRFLTDSTSVSLAKVMRSFINYQMIDEVLWIHYKD